MTVSTLPTSVPQPSLVATSSRGPDRREHVVLTGVSWETYHRLRSECERRHLKMTYDRGRLEIMSPLPHHELATRFIDQIVTITCDELQIGLVGYRGTTWQKQALARGLEADDCYYVQHADIADERGTDIDLDRDPPPDLAVETDITHSTIDKEIIYAALGVPELWRWDNGCLRIRLLAPNGTYDDAAQSRALPMLPRDVIEMFVHRRLQEGERRVRKAFRLWIRDNLLQGPATQGGTSP